MKEAKICWLDQPEVFRVNQLDAHSDHAYYKNYEDFNRNQDRMTQSLNGVWDFYFSKNAKTRPKRFYKEDFVPQGFGKIQVPGHIELAGYDQIRYINTMYPWEGMEYRRGAYSMELTGDGAGMFSEADYNPVGSYLLKFDLEDHMKGKRIRICFEGVEQAMYVWLNGAFVGYAEDSFTPSEFDLTPWIRDRGNILAVQVHKMSTAAFLEDQDFFRFFGIFRNVTLKAVLDTHVEDLWIHPQLNEDLCSGKITVHLKVSSLEEKKIKARFLLKDKTGKQLVEAESDLKKDERGYVGKIQAFPEQIRPWDHGDPVLYEVIVELLDDLGNLLEVVPYKIGFRRLEIRDQVIFLNGKRLILLGVNRHEWSARTGRNIGKKEMKQDLECLQKNHMNAVRTCHYPNQISWYHLCDQAGIYVMSETNLESHGTFQKLGVLEPSCNIPGSIPQWREVVLDRARTHFETLKNHTSILFWSLGNESYAGDNIAAMHGFLKSKNDGRLVHYESVYHNRSYEDRISDVESRMYAPSWEVEGYLKNQPKKPYVLCEFMHNMGNSMGGLSSYMKLLDQYPGYHGGFLWDLIDQALWVWDEVTGKEVLRYGGDFDDRPSDYEFSGNGLLFADRKEKPAMEEVRYYYGSYQ